MSILSKEPNFGALPAATPASIRRILKRCLHKDVRLRLRDIGDARIEIAVIKFWGARVMYNVIDRAIQIHGSLGYTTDLPLESMYRAARAARIYDGPDEVHKVTVARQVLKRYKASEVPTEHVPTRRKAAEAKFADYLDDAAVSS